MDIYVFMKIFIRRMFLFLTCTSVKWWEDVFGAWIVSCLGFEGELFGIVYIQMSSFPYKYFILTGTFYENIINFCL